MKARARVLGALGALALAGTATFAVAAPPGAQGAGVTNHPDGKGVGPRVTVEVEYRWQHFGVHTVPIRSAAKFCQTTAAALRADLAGDGVAACDPRGPFDAAAFSTR